MQCVILAGGIGSRMWPETRTVPKTLLPVQGRPFASWQLQWLAGAGIDSVVYCIGYLGDEVAAYVGDGDQWGLDVSYVDEGEALRGTAGALRLALDQDRLAEDFLVLYGDSWLRVDPVAVLRHLRAGAEPAVMTVFENSERWDTSNVVFDGRRVLRYEKGLTERPTEMRWIDYGLTAFRRHVIAERVLPNQVQDMAPLLTALADEALLGGYEAAERFFEIGSLDGRRDLEEFLARQSRDVLSGPSVPASARRSNRDKA